LEGLLDINSEVLKGKIHRLERQWQESTKSLLKERFGGKGNELCDWRKIDGS